MNKYYCFGIKKSSVKSIVAEMENIFDYNSDHVGGTTYDILVCNNNKNEIILLNKPLGRNNLQSINKKRTVKFSDELKLKDETVQILGVFKCDYYEITAKFGAATKINIDGLYKTYSLSSNNVQ